MSSFSITLLVLFLAALILIPQGLLADDSHHKPPKHKPSAYGDLSSYAPPGYGTPTYGPPVYSRPPYFVPPPVYYRPPYFVPPYYGYGPPPQNPGYGGPPGYKPSYRKEAPDGKYPPANDNTHV